MAGSLSYRTCPQCQQATSATASFCGECGTPLVQVCPRCGQTEDLSTRHCSACGARLTHLTKRSDALPAVRPGDLEAERRHLTVLFCDVVNATALAGALDLEAYGEIIRAYHAVCAEVIEHFEGYIAQHLGDGVLVYFGYPQAHEDDAQRAVRVGLGIVEALKPLQRRLSEEQHVNLRVRVGIHTGLVVIGSMGDGARPERLALGEAPNLAACLQGRATPNSVLISASTARLVQGWFVCQGLGLERFPGFPRPVEVYRVLRESGVESRLDVVGGGSLTPLVGRVREVKRVVEGWNSALQGTGQVIVVSGEAGIGKSRLVRAFRECLADEGHTFLECRCSPYTQHSALYPIISLGRRLLHWQRDEAIEVTRGKLEAAIAPYDFSPPEIVPVFATLLSVPESDRCPAPPVTSAQQRQKAFEAILALLRTHSTRHPVLIVIEDMHWSDPSTLELLQLFIDQEPRDRILILLTARPEFQSPWDLGPHAGWLTLERLLPPQVEEMIDRLTAGKRLPAALRQQMVAKTDGVPLFIEELTKTVLESGCLRERTDHYELAGPLPALSIPTTLQASLMARLDRLGEAKEVAQLAATLGRSFPYELLQAVSPWEAARLQRALAQLTQAELLHRQGNAPQQSYIFKHALIRDTAYQSLLRRNRQQYHRLTASVLEQRFPEITATQPELLAHHYSEAGLVRQALPYWQRAGQHAVARSATREAISHFTSGLELLKTLPHTPERAQHELALQLAMGPPLRMLKGETAAEIAGVYDRAYELSQQVGDQRQQFAALLSLSRLAFNRAQIEEARRLAEQCFHLARASQDADLLQEGHRRLGSILFYHGDLIAARRHCESGLAVSAAQRRQGQLSGERVNPSVTCLCYLAWTLWLLGYPEQACQRSEEALRLAQQAAHAYSLAVALHYAAVVRLARREGGRAQALAEETMAVSEKHGFALWSVMGMTMRGWALVDQGLAAPGLAQLRDAQVAWQAMGKNLAQTHSYVRLAEAYRQGGHIEAGLQAVTKGLHAMETTAERYQGAELHRLKGLLLLQQAIGREEASDAPRQGVLLAEAETHLHRALAIARCQQAKSLELRAATDLSRLWQRQGNLVGAWQLLKGVYDWFTEGFETLDLQEAGALLTALDGTIRLPPQADPASVSDWTPTPPP